MTLPTQDFLQSLLPAQTNGIVSSAAVMRQISAAIPDAIVSITGTTVSVTISGVAMSASLAGTATFGTITQNSPSIADANASSTQTGKAPT